MWDNTLHGDTTSHVLFGVYTFGEQEAYQGLKLGYGHIPGVRLEIIILQCRGLSYSYSLSAIGRQCGSLIRYWWLNCDGYLQYKGMVLHSPDSH